MSSPNTGVFSTPSGRTYTFAASSATTYIITGDPIPRSLIKSPPLLILPIYRRTKRFMRPTRKNSKTSLNKLQTLAVPHCEQLGGEKSSYYETFGPAIESFVAIIDEIPSNSRIPTRSTLGL